MIDDPNSTLVTFTGRRPRPDQQRRIDVLAEQFRQPAQSDVLHRIARALERIADKLERR